jgi:pyrroloquinoline quinone (PQQ) biosynthesis protein C
MSTLQEQFRARRVYEVTPVDGGAFSLRLKDRMVELGKSELENFHKVAAWLPTTAPVEELARDVGMEPKRIERFLSALEKTGLVYRIANIPASASGEEFHAKFNEALSSWLSEAFAHPFWERMMSGRGSARLFTGWLIELYHYTRNANRHMPLSCAHTHSKPIKLLRAKHYAEEWNHYHYFMKSLKALGFTDGSIAESVPLPMTLALSNFMRQAAREDVLAYSICSAVLEGTTTDRRTYNPYYEKAAELYGVPREAINPIYAHLDLDVQYQHSDLFHDILKTVDNISATRATTILNYGHQLVEHIWLWTDNIERYYDVESNPVPRRPFDPLLD